MSIGGSIGQGAIGELIDAGVAGVDILVPAPTAFVFVAKFPSISGGTSVSVPPGITNWVARAPVTQTGWLVDVPPATSSFVSKSPFVSGGSLAVVPAPSSWAFSALSPVIAAGASVLAPSVSTSFVSRSPYTQTGWLVDVPPATMAFSALSPQILQSANILVVAPTAFGILGVVPKISGGSLVDASDSRTFYSHAGHIGDGSIGGFGIGEGGTVPYIVKRPVTMNMTAADDNIKIQAGVLIDVPCCVMSMRAVPPRVHSRRRKLVTLAIAS